MPLSSADKSVIGLFAAAIRLPYEREVSKALKKGKMLMELPEVLQVPEGRLASIIV